MKKTCPECELEKSIDDFHKSSTRSDGHQRLCKLCANEKARASSKRNYTAGSKNKPTHRKHHLTFEQFESMLAAQDGLCSICKISEATHIDHDHSCCPGPYSCGRCVRGLLCHNCNTALGLVKESVSTLAAMVDYVQQHMLL
jgi:hypothetical protein